MSQRRIENPLALAALSCLAERAMHPYEIAATLRERHTDQAIKLNYGSLYSVMEALARHGLITAQQKLKQGKRPERTIYALTEAGALELSDWLSELLSVPAREYLQLDAGLALIAVLPPATAATLLQRRCETLEIAAANLRSILTQTREKQLVRLFVLDLEYRLARAELELGWVRELANEIREGTLDGVREWRKLHTPSRARGKAKKS